MAGMCEYCGKQLKEGESYICPACGRRFCAAHHEPQHHNCSGVKPVRARTAHTTLNSPRSGPRRRSSGSCNPKNVAIIAVVVIVVAALAGLILFGGDLFSGMFSSGSTTTSGSSASGSSASAEATAAATSSGSSGTSSTSQTAVVTATATEVIVPSDGVYVYADYIGKFTGLYGTSDNLQTASGSSTKYYLVDNASGIISAGFIKADSSTKGHTLTVRIYKNGAILKEGTTTDTHGTVNITASV